MTTTQDIAVEAIETSYSKTEHESKNEKFIRLFGIRKFNALKFPKKNRRGTPGAFGKCKNMPVEAYKQD